MGPVSPLAGLHPMTQSASTAASVAAPLGPFKQPVRAKRRQRGTRTPPKGPGQRIGATVALCHIEPSAEAYRQPRRSSAPWSRLLPRPCNSRQHSAGLFIKPHAMPFAVVHTHSDIYPAFPPYVSQDHQPPKLGRQPVQSRRQHRLESSCPGCPPVVVCHAAVSFEVCSCYHSAYSLPHGS